MTVRIPFGGGIHAPEHHSESTEAMLAQIPGLRVVVPSSPQRAYSLLLSAIDCNDPVIFLEPKRIYRSTKQLVEDDGKRLPLDSCFTLREGQDITLVSWGAMIKETMEAAEQLADEGIDAEVIDLASVSPMDRLTIRASVRKTSRLVIVQEAIRSSGVGAEISADIASHCFAQLSAPIKRVTGYDITMPYYRLEHDVMPQAKHIIQAAKRTMEGT
jgi:pyruvate dehydrogenase E1 component beta subunit